MSTEGRVYIPVLDIEKCNICAVCTKGCPAEVIAEERKEKSSLRGRVYQDAKTTPSLWNEPAAMPPCQEACPIHQDIEGYMRLIAERRYRDALELIRETNALPSVTGYVCHRPCEAKCIRSLVEEPASIRVLKRFVADLDDGELRPPAIKRRREKRVSIIGSGPSGLTAAHDLARDGYLVEIIEAFPEPGGMLRWTIPSFRLPRKIVHRDISYIKKMGVIIKTGLRFGIDVTLPDLKKSGTDAVIMAIGTHQGSRLDIANEGTGGYLDCLDFLERYASGCQLNLGGKVIVIGGGNAAIDTARSAIRCGAKEVEIVYRRSRQEMPADRDEIEEAEVEGVKISYLTMPVRVIERDGQVQGLQCARTELGEPDESGLRKPIAVRGSDFVINATWLISAIGQQPDLSWNQENLPFDLSSEHAFAVNDKYLTSIDGVFATGDAVNGPTTIVEAMASGTKVAESVALYLC